MEPASRNPRSLLVTNRTAGFMGPSRNLLGVNGIVAGATYRVSAYVLLAAPDASNPTATLSTKLTNCGTSGIFSNIATSGALSSTAWTQVQGNFMFTNVPGPPTSLILYIQSSSATDSFYVSNVVITEVAPPPPDPSLQDNTGITTGFEDGGVDGWSTRAGAAATNSTATAHSGTQSLLITGRTHNYDGPQINVANKMYNGSRHQLPFDRGPRECGQHDRESIPSPGATSHRARYERLQCGRQYVQLWGEWRHRAGFRPGAAGI